MSRGRPSLARLAGWGLAIGGLAWVFHDVHPMTVLAGAGRWWWPGVALAVTCDVAAYLCQAWRWTILLRPWGRIPVAEAARAVYAGLFTSEMLPLRAGELVRSYLVARRLAVDLLAVLASVAVERLIDGVWLALAVGAVAILVPLPPALTRAADLLGIAVLASTAAFGLALAIGRRERRRPGEPVGALGRAATALVAVGSPGRLAAAFGASAGVLGFQALGFWILLRAYGVPLSPWAGAAVLLLVVLGTAIPNAPGNVGSWQFFCVLGLVAFGVDKSIAAAFSVGGFLLLTTPLWAIGAWAIGSTGKTLGQLRSDAARAASDRHERA